MESFITWKEDNRNRDKIGRRSQKAASAEQERLIGYKELNEIKSLPGDVTWCFELVTEDKQSCSRRHCEGGYVRLGVRPAAVCGRRGRTSSRAPRYWREEAGWPLPRKCGRLSHDGFPRCRVTGAVKDQGFKVWDKSSDISLAICLCLLNLLTTINPSSDKITFTDGKWEHPSWSNTFMWLIVCAHSKSLMEPFLSKQTAVAWMLRAKNKRDFWEKWAADLYLCR